MSGLSTDDIRLIINILKKYPEIEEVYLFGSRAKGNQKIGSDVDIAIKGKLSSNLTSRVSGELNNDTPLPYTFDVVAFDTLENIALKEHIQRVGILLYAKTKSLE